MTEPTRLAAVRAASMWDRKPTLTDAEIELSASMSCADHTESPIGYTQASYWAEEMEKTHKQLICGECLLWKIWVPRSGHQHR